MNDTIRGTRAEGTVLLDGKNIYAPDVDVAELRQRIGMVFQRPNPVSAEHLRQRRLWPARAGHGQDRAANWTRSCSESLEGAGAVGRGQAPPAGLGAGT